MPNPMRLFGWRKSDLITKPLFSPLPGQQSGQLPGPSSGLLLAFVLSLSLGLTSTAKAEPIASFAFIKQNLRTVLAGAASTVVIHELGHFAAAEFESVDVEYDGVTIVYPDQDLTQKQRLRLSSAGYQTQWLASELAFHQLDKPELSVSKKAFNTGMVLGHIGISLAYLTVLKGHEHGDSLGTASAGSLSEDQVLLALAIPAALDSWRLFGNNPPKWLPMLSKGTKAVGIAAVWSF